MTKKYMLSYYTKESDRWMRNEMVFFADSLDEAKQEAEKQMNEIYNARLVQLEEGEHFPKSFKINDLAKCVRYYERLRK